MANQTTVTAEPGKQELFITREFNAPRELVFRAHTEAKLYEQLSEGGEQQPCGWLVDKFGLSWQITPRVLMELLSSPDREKSGRVAQAMFKMNKLVIADLEAGAAG